MSMMRMWSTLRLSLCDEQKNTMLVKKASDLTQMAPVGV